MNTATETTRCHLTGEEERQNPRLLEELPIAQADGVRKLSRGLDVDLSETLRRLVGLALFNLGLDSAGWKTPEELLRAVVDEKDVDAIANDMLQAESDARIAVINREAAERAEARELRGRSKPSGTGRPTTPAPRRSAGHPKEV